jgi:hypothetical protein
MAAAATPLATGMHFALVSFDLLKAPLAALSARQRKRHGFRVSGVNNSVL